MIEKIAQKSTVVSFCKKLNFFHDREFLEIYL